MYLLIVLNRFLFQTTKCLLKWNKWSNISQQLVRLFVRKQWKHALKHVRIMPSLLGLLKKLGARTMSFTEDTYQTLGRVFHQTAKHLEVRQKCSAARCIFNSLLRGWKCWWNTLSRVSLIYYFWGKIANPIFSQIIIYAVLKTGHVPRHAS